MRAVRWHSRRADSGLTTCEVGEWQEPLHLHHPPSNQPFCWSPPPPTRPADLHEGKEGFVDHGHEDAVDNEAGAVLTRREWRPEGHGSHCARVPLGGTVGTRIRSSTAGRHAKQALCQGMACRAAVQHRLPAWIGGAAAAYLRHAGCLAQVAGQALAGLERFVAGGHAAHQLNQAHHRHLPASGRGVWQHGGRSAGSVDAAHRCRCWCQHAAATQHPAAPQPARSPPFTKKCRPTT